MSSASLMVPVIALATRAAVLFDLTPSRWQASFAFAIFRRPASSRRTQYSRPAARGCRLHRVTERPPRAHPQGRFDALMLHCIGRERCHVVVSKWGQEAPILVNVAVLRASSFCRKSASAAWRWACPARQVGARRPDGMPGASVSGPGSGARLSAIDPLSAHDRHANAALQQGARGGTRRVAPILAGAFGNAVAARPGGAGAANCIEIGCCCHVLGQTTSDCLRMTLR